MNLFPKIGNGQVVKIVFPEKMIRDLLESHYFLKFSMKRWGKKFGKNKHLKIIFYLSN